MTTLNGGSRTRRRHSFLNSNDRSSLPRILVTFCLIISGLLVGYVARLNILAIRHEQDNDTRIILAPSLIRPPGTPSRRIANNPHSASKMGNPSFPQHTTTDETEPSSNYIISSSSVSPNNHTLLFVHVGKSGGETLKDQLRMICMTRRARRVKQKCLKSWNYSRLESSLSTHTTGYRHCSQEVFPLRTKKTHSAFLFTIRNPVDRMVSVFNYINPSACRFPSSVPCQTKQFISNAQQKGEPTVAGDFFQCFSSPNEFSLSFSSTDDKCEKVARQVIQANHSFEHPLAHSYFNYRYYMNVTVRRHPEKPVFVIRTEHFWEDFRQIDRILGGSGVGYDGVGAARRHEDGKKVLEDLTVSPEGMLRLCCAVQNEILVYHELLERAVNLNPSRRNETMQALFSQCHWESLDDMTRTCIS